MRLKAGLAESPTYEAPPSASLQPGLFKDNFPRSTTKSPKTRPTADQDGCSYTELLRALPP